MWPRGNNLRNVPLVNLLFDATVCLASAASRHMTGQVLFMDGGASIV